MTEDPISPVYLAHRDGLWGASTQRRSALSHVFAGSAEWEETTARKACDAWLLDQGLPRCAPWESGPGVSRTLCGPPGAAARHVPVGGQVRNVVTTDDLVLVVADDIAAWLESDGFRFVGMGPHDEAVARAAVAAIATRLRERIPRWRSDWVGPRAVLSLAAEPGQVPRLSTVRNDSDQSGVDED